MKLNKFGYPIIENLKKSLLEDRFKKAMQRAKNKSMIEMWQRKIDDLYRKPEKIN